MKIILFCILSALFTSFVFASEKNSPQSECVGRLAFNFPYKVEIASASYEEAKKQISHPNFSPKYSFSDGETTWSSQISYLGPIFISNGLTSEQMASMRNIFFDERNKTVDFFEKNNIKNNGKIGGILNISKNTFAWNIENRVRALSIFDKELIFYDISKNDELQKNIAIVTQFSIDAIPRKLFEIPSVPGLCMPYIFIKTNNFEHRNIEATYKLLDHPDITFWISESSAEKNSDSNREKNSQPKNIINSFWSQFGNRKGVKAIEPILSHKNGASITLAGRKGIASYVKIVREGGVEDYGYYASSRGDPGNEDAPDINIYVMRNSLSSHGEVPVNQEKFMEIVETLQSKLTLRRN